MLQYMILYLFLLLIAIAVFYCSYTPTKKIVQVYYKGHILYRPATEQIDAKGKPHYHCTIHMIGGSEKLILYPHGETHERNTYWRPLYNTGFFKNFDARYMPSAFVELDRQQNVV